MNEINKYALQREIDYLHYFFDQINKTLGVANLIFPFVFMIEMHFTKPSLIMAVSSSMVIFLSGLFHIIFMVLAHRSRTQYYESIMANYLLKDDIYGIVHRQTNRLEDLFDVLRLLFFFSSLIFLISISIFY